MADVLERLAAALADRYAIAREIGSGGMATVYLGRDRRHERDVAVKVLKPDLAAALGTERFLREIRITARLNHPHVLPLLDSGEAGGFLYYVMPHVDGGSLRRLLAREPRLAVDVVVRVVSQVASALDHAHRQGVVHRDVKPENILFQEGLALVADFGIARAVGTVSRDQLTKSGFPLGTPGYMSPEQAAGRLAPDARTDVFALSCVAYEMLAGETPAMWPTDEEVRLGRLADAPSAHRARLDALPGRVEQVLVRALALRPQDRFATPGEFASALASAAEGTPKLDDEEMRLILQRAAELDASAPEVGALSIGGVEQVAAQVGIPPERVREALVELRPAPAPPRPAAVPAEREPRIPASLRAPPPPRLRKGRVELDRTVPGALPESACEEMIEEIQRTLGFVGTAGVVGRTLNWSGTKPGFIGRDVRVTVVRGDAETHVHVEEHIDLRGASMFAPGYGAAAGVLSGLGLVLATGLPEAAAGVLAVPLGILGGVLSANGIVRATANTRWPELWDLAERLEALARSRSIAGAPTERAKALSPGAAPPHPLSPT